MIKRSTSVHLTKQEKCETVVEKLKNSKKFKAKKEVQAQIVIHRIELRRQITYIYTLDFNGGQIGILLACVASVSVEQRAKNGVFSVLPARKMGREQKRKEGVGEGSEGNACGQTP